MFNLFKRVFVTAVLFAFITVTSCSHSRKTKPNSEQALRLSTTVVSTTKKYELMDATELIRVKNSLKNWEVLFGAENVLMLADDAKACQWIADDVSPEIKCIKHDCWLTKYNIKRPGFDCLFATAIAATQTEKLCWINNDMMFPSKFPEVIMNSFEIKAPHVLVVGRRVDVPIRTPLNFDGDWETEVTSSVGDSTLHDDWGIDYFVFKKETFKYFKMLPFAVGAWRWDNYWLANAMLNPEVTVVDSTPASPCYHQGVDSDGDRNSNHSIRVGAEHNNNLVIQGLGARYLLGRTVNSDFIINQDLATTPNILKSDLSRLASLLQVNEVSDGANVPTVCAVNSHCSASPVGAPLVLLGDNDGCGAVEKPVICRQNSSADFKSLVVDEPEFYTSEILRTQFLSSYVRLGVPFRYETSDVNKKLEKIYNKLERKKFIGDALGNAAATDASVCDVTLRLSCTGECYLSIVTENVRAIPLWKIAAKCQLKGWHGVTGEIAESICFWTVADEKWVQENIKICKEIA